MNEYLFKLKKDRKTVGYLKYDKYRPEYNNDLEVYGNFIDDSDDDWREGVTPDFDEMLSFVTKDRNGKDVFAGDTVKADKWYFEVIWQKCGFGLKGKKSGWWRQFHEFESIELIEDKE